MNSTNDETGSAAHFFVTTRWDDLREAARSGERESKRALQRIYLCYWGPLCAHARRLGVPESDVEDVVQDFMLELLDRARLQRLNPAQGRFRAYLRVALRNRVNDRRDRQMAARRVGGISFAEWNEAEQGHPAGEADETAFDRDWGHELLRGTLDRLRKETEEIYGASCFERIQPFVLEEGGCSGEEIADALGITLPALKSRIFRMRRRFREILRQEVRRTVESDAACEDELRYLCSVCMGHPFEGGSPKF